MKTYVISGVTILAIVASSIAYINSNGIYASPAYVERRISETKDFVSNNYVTKDELEQRDKKISDTYEMVKALYLKLIPDAER